MSSALRTGRALIRRNIISLLLVLICWRMSKLQGLVRPEELGTLKKKIIYLIGSRTATFRLVAESLNH
jgi:hypothetical protein